jgi:3-hydroxyisobutyrate dehydrogenase-like beta-hydroxyacid dehydrogenase
VAIRKISVIGLGLMGTAITKLLINAGFSVTGYDIVKRKITDLTRIGLRSATSPKNAVTGAELILLSLPNWTAVKNAVEGRNGILEGARRGQIVVDTSTVPPNETRAMALKLARKGITWMDAPISGSSSQAAEGNMVFMVGGRRTVFKKIRPVLDRIGKKTVYVGKNGDAAMLKLVVNHTLYLNQAAAIEGLVLGIKAGLDPRIMLDVLSSGAASSDIIASRGKNMINDNFKAKGSLAIAVKDLSISLDFAHRLGVMLPMGALYSELLLQAERRGWGKSDATVAMRIYEELAGIGKYRRFRGRRTREK